jgi:hypothetical protein
MADGSARVSDWNVMMGDSGETARAHAEGHDLAHLLKIIPHKPGWFERHAACFLKERTKARPLTDAEVAAHYPAYVLTEEERAAVNGVVRKTVIRSFLTGALSAGLCVATWLLLPSFGVTSFFGRWAGVGVASVIATIFEMWRIYFDHLNAVCEMLIVTGTRLAATREEEIGEDVAHALARASLDLPDPLRVIEEIDPERETSHLVLLASVVLYKGKRSISNFLAKEVVLHFTPTSIARAIAPIISVPVTGAWNALVSWRVLREVRLRAVGPSAIAELCDALLPGEGEAPVSEGCRTSLLRAVGCAMVRKHAAHPNLLELLRRLAPHVGACRAHELDDTKRFVDGLVALPPPEQVLVLEILQVAAVLDGHVRKKLKALVSDARRACGLAPETVALDELERRFLAGERIDMGLIEALAK